MLSAYFELSEYIHFVLFSEYTDPLKMPAEVNVEYMPNMEGDNYPDGMDLFVYRFYI
jgi:hypothetical protein